MPTRLYRWFLFREYPNRPRLLMDESLALYGTFEEAQHFAEIRLSEHFWEPFEHRYYIVDNYNTIYDEHAAVVTDDIEFAALDDDDLRVASRRPKWTRFCCCLCPC